MSIASIHALPWRVCHLLIDTGRLLFRSFERCLFSRLNKFPQPVPPGKVLQPFDPLDSPLLNLLQYISGFPVLGSPKLYTVFYMWSNEHWVKGDYYIPGCASGETIQDAGCCWASLLPSRLLTHAQLAAHHDSQILLNKSDPQLVCPQPVLLPGLFLLRCRTSHLSLMYFIRLWLTCSSSLSRSLAPPALP